MVWKPARIYIFISEAMLQNWNKQLEIPKWRLDTFKKNLFEKPLAL